MKNFLTLQALTASALLAIAGTSQASTISVTQFVGVDNDLDFTTTSVTRGFDVQNANSVLVALIYLDSPSSSVTGMQYAGVNPFLSVSDDRGHIFVWKDPTTTASDFTFTAGNPSGGIIMWELAGVDLNAAITQSSIDTITTTVDNAFVLTTGWRNATAALAAPTGFTTDYAGDVRNGNRMGGAHLTIASPSVVDVNWSSDAEGSPYSLAFAPVPEPSSLALMALGGLGLGGVLIARRRRRD